MKYILVLVLFLTGCASMQPANNTSIFEEKMGILEYKLKTGQIGELDHAKAALAAATQYFPNDNLLIALRQEKVALASALERGSINKEEYQALWESRKSNYNEMRSQRDARVAQQQNQPMNPMQTLIMMNAINQTANRIGHSLDTPQFSVNSPVNCQSYASGNGVNTTCY
ncbi:MAG TPA: hypothetical protein VHB01_04410 [Nitrosospira sp.]|nr:hypothetical protein [Nitrosospira sp.]